MKNRHIVTCMPGTDTARSIYFDVLKPLVTPGRLSMKSYLDFPIPDEFSRTIRTWIHLSNVVVAIIEDQRSSNVFYEIGVAVGFGKPVILLADSVDHVPNMLRATNVIVFNSARLDLPTLRSQMEDALLASLMGTMVDRRFHDHVHLLLYPPAHDVDGGATASGDIHADGDEVQAGIASYNSQHHAEAIAQLERALNSGSRDPDTYFYLADSYFFHGESLPLGTRQRSAYQRMQHVATDGCRAYPTDRRLRKTRALASMKLGDFDTAERVFMELFAEDSEYMHAPYNLACLCALQRKSHRCVRFLREVFQKAPEWRFLARLDPDFDEVWKDELVQRVLYPCTINPAI
jgi:tetratricopeptide (TPR) repeat protein